MSLIANHINHNISNTEAIPDKAHPIIFIFIVISIMRKWDFGSYSPEKEHVRQETFVFITWLTI